MKKYRDTTSLPADDITSSAGGWWRHDMHTLDTARRLAEKERQKGEEAMRCGRKLERTACGGCTDVLMQFVSSVSPSAIRGWNRNYSVAVK